MSSLTHKNGQLMLEGKPFFILSGSVHYFRIVPGYWKDRLEKAKACGLNTVDTYVPWNCHEPHPGIFKSDGILDIRKFIQTAWDTGLKVILRPGPYICSEWDFGGLPSWLLADPNMKVRSNYQGYKDAAEKYLKWVLGLLVDLQYSKGGPIIAVQVENEFGSYSDDIGHLLFLRDTIRRSGITELLVTSDNPWGINPSLNMPGVVATANFQTVDEGKAVFEVIDKIDPEFPPIVMEFWSGWFDHWGSAHHQRSVDLLEKSLKFIFNKNGSVNFYMFHGGTNFGFMAGANQTDTYKPDVTSYDYDAPLTEHGDLTNKYFKIRDMIKEYLSKQGLHLDPMNGLVVSGPQTISQSREILVEEILPWSEIVKLTKKVTSSFYLRPMEVFTYPNGQVQSYGYIVYRKNIELTQPTVLVLPPYVRDRALVILNGEVVANFDWRSVNLSATLIPTSSGLDHVLDIVVENLGRVNYTEKTNPDVLNRQRKGMEGEATLGDKSLNDWTIIAIDFDDIFISTIRQSSSWLMVGRGENAGNTTMTSPSLCRCKFDVSGNPLDCFVKLDGFSKGIVIINGFNLGRYWDIGPQRTLYLPGPLLVSGKNEILVFDELKYSKVISLEPKPALE